MKFPDWLKTQTDLMLDDPAYVITAAICAIAMIAMAITSRLKNGDIQPPFVLLLASAKGCLLFPAKERSNIPSFFIDS